MERACLVKVSGRVTGVGFRYSALAYAADLPELKGYVRNVSEDEVEALVQGPEEQVEQMIQWLRRGPSRAIIVDFKISPMPLEKGLSRFTIR